MVPQRSSKKQIVVPHLSNKTLANRAKEYLKANGYLSSLPIDVERLCDDIDVSILPIPELEKILQIDAYIADDCAVIVVDQACFENNIPRARFSIAHELSHKILHTDILRQFNITDVESYQVFRSQIDSGKNGAIEAQAYSLAGHILMPTELLRLEIRKRLPDGDVKSISIDGAAQIVRELVSIFNVSDEALIRQLKKSCEDFYNKLLELPH